MNQGLNNYVPRENATVLRNVVSISANGANTGATFFQSKDFTVLQDSYAIKLKTDENLNEKQWLFLTGSIKKSIYGKYEWTNKANWEKVKSDIINLPICGRKIDYDFMDTFISELEAYHISELEAYLTATGLKDYKLTKEEEKIIKKILNNEINYKKYKIIDIFDVINSSNILSSEVVENSGDVPYLGATSQNNGVLSYISYNEDLKEQGNCIFIGGKTFVVTYQEKDFYSNDSHNLSLYYKNTNSINKNIQLFFCSSIYKSMHLKYFWNNSISKTKIKDDYLMLPVNSKKEIDINLMNTIISAIQKIVIKDVVLYSENKISATKKVVNKNNKNTKNKKENKNKKVIKRKLAANINVSNLIDKIDKKK